MATVWGTRSRLLIVLAQGEFPIPLSSSRADHNIRDTFTGAYASDYLRQREEGRWDIKSAVIRANKAAALTITRLGAQGGIPWSDEIDHFDAPFNNPDVSTATISNGIDLGRVDSIDLEK